MSVRGYCANERWSAEAQREETATGIDAEMLERMARIARDLPGHTVSLDSDDGFELPPDSDPILRIDGVVADEILERCYDELW